MYNFVYTREMDAIREHIFSDPARAQLWQGTARAVIDPTPFEIAPGVRMIIEKPQPDTVRFGLNLLKRPAVHLKRPIDPLEEPEVLEFDPTRNTFIRTPGLSRNGFVFIGEVVYDNIFSLVNWPMRLYDRVRVNGYQSGMMICVRQVQNGDMLENVKLLPINNVTGSHITGTYPNLELYLSAVLPLAGTTSFDICAGAGCTPLLTLNYDRDIAPHWNALDILQGADTVEADIGIPSTPARMILVAAGPNNTDYLRISMKIPLNVHQHPFWGDVNRLFGIDPDDRRFATASYSPSRIFFDEHGTWIPSSVVSTVANALNLIISALKPAEHPLEPRLDYVVFNPETRITRNSDSRWRIGEPSLRGRAYLDIETRLRDILSASFVSLTDEEIAEMERLTRDLKAARDLLRRGDTTIRGQVPLCLACKLPAKVYVEREPEQTFCGAACCQTFFRQKNGKKNSI